MKDNPLRKLGTLGQSIWLDYIRRDLIASNELRRLIEEDGLRGMTARARTWRTWRAGRLLSFDDLMATLEKAVQK